MFSSENEIQPNYIRIRFDLQKTEYNTSNPTLSCKNSTVSCSLPLNFFSNQRTVLELPLTGNDSQWNEEYVVVSTCEPRTAVYVVCIISVPLLVLIFAFHWKRRSSSIRGKLIIERELSQVWGRRNEVIDMTFDTEWRIFPQWWENSGAWRTRLSVNLT